jgi:hypothetical protein
MVRQLGGLLVVVLLLTLVSRGAWSGEKAEKEEEKALNPYYKFWAKTKPGSSAVLVERTKLGAAAKESLVGEDEKTIKYKLISLDDKKAVVETVVTEQEFFGFVQTAPTHHIYPAQVKKGLLEKFYSEAGLKKGEDTLTVKGKEIKCLTASGVLKGPGGEETSFKYWLSEEIPGGVVKEVRTTRVKGEVIGETVITLKSFKAAD